ncbi:ASCH domain-containing protein [Thalassoroseus pseudoceratinae]|uniref:ASCH domain-containing protein n=1 Tax=Thalassoroseus pseudoceratinae TaxID=2713176 RepID=UPI00141D8C6F|nr:ASCH domain-containing protein [Thalassoroseus pseudoceratinae]
MEPDFERIALGIRQPWAELILRGIKTIEVRSSHTRQRGTIYVYASKKISNNAAADLMVEEHGLDLDELPRGVIVGTVQIVDSVATRPQDEDQACLPPTLLDGKFGWRLQDASRLEEPLTPRFLPYGVWFYPFRRRSSGSDGE